MDIPSMRTRIPHVDGFVHLNNAAGSLADAAVIEAMTAHLEREARMGNTEAMRAVAGELDALYDELAGLIGVPKHRVSVAGSNTFAWQMAFAAIPLSSGDRILVGESEWGGNLSAIWQRCQATGASMEVVPSDAHGAIDVQALSDRLDDRVRTVAVTWAPAVNGLLNPVARIANALANHPAWLFVDAAQAFEQVATDPLPRIDVLTVSARKYVRGPRGTGFAAYSQRFLDGIEPIGLDQFSGPWSTDAPEPRRDARKFEFGEASYAVRLGLLSAVRGARPVDPAGVYARIATLAGRARDGLTRVEDIEVCDTNPDLSGLVTFSHARVAAGDVVAALAAEGINAAAPPPIYAPLWFRTRPHIVRLAPHAFNTEAEIDRALAVIETVATP